MIGKLLFAGVAAAALALSQAASQPAAGTLTVQWEIERPEEPGEVQLSLRHRTATGSSHNSSGYALSDLEGLDPGRDGPARFRLAREAGTLDCSGDLRGGRGSGECRFAADSGYAEALDRRGIGRPDLSEQYQLALQDVRLALVDELERQGYRRPEVGELVALGIHGADLDYLRGLDSAGYRVGDPDKLVAMRIHGVSVDFIRELAALGYPAPTAEQLVSMRIHGVTPEFIRGMAEAGYRGIAAEQLISLRIHGVTPEDARQANARAGL